MLQLDISLHVVPLFAELMQSRSLTTKHSPLMTPLVAFWIRRIPNSREEMSEFHLLQRLRCLHRSGTGNNASPCSVTSHGSFSPESIARRLELFIGDPLALCSFLELDSRQIQPTYTPLRSSERLIGATTSLTAARLRGRLHSSKLRLPPTSATRKCSQDVGIGNPYLGNRS